MLGRGSSVKWIPAFAGMTEAGDPGKHRNESPLGVRDCKEAVGFGTCAQLRAGCVEEVSGLEPLPFSRAV
jgi:hypothetical protein